MRNKLKILLVATVLLSLSACRQNEVYFSYQAVPASGWAKDSVMLFDYNIEDPASRYDVYIHVRHRNDYPYQNMWVFMESGAADSAAIAQKDTIEFYLADDFGKWLGTGAGALKEMTVLYRQNVLYPDSGSYTLQLKQGMRDSLLRGVSEVGLRVERVQD